MRSQKSRWAHERKLAARYGVGVQVVAAAIGRGELRRSREHGWQISEADFARWMRGSVGRPCA